MLYLIIFNLIRLKFDCTCVFGTHRYNDVRIEPACVSKYSSDDQLIVWRREVVAFINDCMSRCMTDSSGGGGTVSRLIRGALISADDDCAARRAMLTV